MCVDIRHILHIHIFLDALLVQCLSLSLSHASMVVSADLQIHIHKYST